MSRFERQVKRRNKAAFPLKTRSLSTGIPLEVLAARYKHCHKPQQHNDAQFGEVDTDPHGVPFTQR